MHSNNNIHIISIGGSVMHDLAINLKKNGNVVTGSDDKIYEPSKSNLKKNNLYPKKLGYHKENIAKNLDFVITGMHTKSDNIELQTAKKNRIPIYSYPEFIRKSSDNKHRIVIAGSHGKTTVTSIIMHVLKKNKIKFDYVIGGRADGFTSNIKISENPLIIIEGDEYLTSPLDKNPKFLKYDHHIVLLNGIEWDHCNVFPNKKVYIKQFQSLINKTPKGGEIIYYDGDNNVEKVINDFRNEDVTLKSYNREKSMIKNNICYIYNDSNELVKINIFGKHNLQNLAGSKLVCEQLGIKSKNFYEAIKSYQLPENRLSLILNKKNKVFRDFAHSPSKLSSTIEAVKKFHKKKLLVVYELHSSSSFNKKFLKTYKDTLSCSDDSIIYLSESILKNKKIKKPSINEMRSSFNCKKIKYVNDPKKLETLISKKIYINHNKLFMSSGNFDGLNIQKIVK